MDPSLADLRRNLTDLVTVEDQLCGLQSGHLGGDLGDLVAWQVDNIQLLQTKQGQRKTPELVEGQTNFPTQKNDVKNPSALMSDPPQMFQLLKTGWEGL